MLCAGWAITPMPSLHLPTSPYISLYLPISPYISLYLPITPRLGHHPHAASPCISPVSPLYLAGSGITPMLQALRRLVAEPSDTTEVSFSPSPSP